LKSQKGCFFAPYDVCKYKPYHPVAFGWNKNVSRNIFGSFQVKIIESKFKYLFWILMEKLSDITSYKPHMTYWRLWTRTGDLVTLEQSSAIWWRHLEPTPMYINCCSVIV
jgi:hypothetical protein